MEKKCETARARKITPILYIIVPCYNEESVLPVTSKIFLDKLQGMIERRKIKDESRILFVNDGSRDGTWELICSLAREERHYAGISLSRNRGHQNAVLAGLMTAKSACDITITIDCDGQDEPDAMEKMVDEWNRGAEIVYGVRSSRKTDTFFKRFTAESFYRIMGWMGVETVFNHADYRLLSRRVLKELSGYQEVNLFLRGMIPLIGFQSSSVCYERQERLKGESHYTLKKMVALAVDGITSLSTKPIRLITGLGLIIAFLSFIGVLWSVMQVFAGETVQGWGSIVSIVCFLSGIQLLSLGIIGEYIGKIYMETKHRPRFIISETTWELEEEV